MIQLIRCWLSGRQTNNRQAACVTEYVQDFGFRTNKPIRTPEDFKGINLLSGVLQNIWGLEQVGANPVRIPGRRNLHGAAAGDN